MIVLLAVAVSGFGQMGTGRGGFGTGMGSSLGGMMGGSLYGMMGGSGLSVGPDGTLYLTRSVVAGQGQSNPATSTQLTAIAANGNVLWTLPISSNSASQPALGKDGTLFVTTSDWFNWMYDWMFSRITPPTATNTNLLVIKPGTTSATIAATVPLTGGIASAPQIATDAAGSYVVYVVSVDAFSANGMNTTSSSGSYLYAFSPSGTLKYRLQISQGGGMMGGGMMGF